MENQKETIAWVDWIRALATLGVVLIHTAGPLLYGYNQIPESYWWISNIYDSAARMCVPLFFMISGFLLLQQDDSLKTFFSKRIHKVFIPFLAWSMFFIFWKVYVERSALLSPDSLFSLVYKPAYFHLWFLYALIGVYLSVPLLKVIVKHATTTVLHYGVALWFVTASLMHMIEEFTVIQGSIDLRFMAGYSGFMLLGWLLGKKSVSKKNAVAACILAFLCIVSTALITYVLTLRNGGTLVDYFYGPTTPIVIVLSGSVFLVIRYAVENYHIAINEKVLLAVRSISASSFGIYMVHVVFLYLLRHGHLGIYLYADRWHPLIGIPVVTGVAFFLSYGTIHLIRKISLPIVIQATSSIKGGLMRFLRKSGPMRKLTS